MEYVALSTDRNSYVRAYKMKIYITISEKKGRNISEREKCQIFTCNITCRNISEILCEVGISPKGQKYLIYVLNITCRNISELWHDITNLNNLT